MSKEHTKRKILVLSESIIYTAMLIIGIFLFNFGIQEYFVALLTVIVCVLFYFSSGGWLPISSIGNFLKRTPAIEDKNVRPESHPLRHENNNPNYMLNMIISDYAVKSKDFQKRAGVYLFFGLLLGIGALFYFMWHLPDAEGIKKLIYHNNKTNNSIFFFFMFTRISLVTFILYFATFLLKQFRLSNSEMRYYDKVRRILETNLLIIKCVESEKLKELPGILDFYKNHELYENDLSMRNRSVSLKDNLVIELIKLLPKTNSNIRNVEKS